MRGMEGRQEMRERERVEEEARNGRKTENEREGEG